MHRTRWQRCCACSWGAYMKDNVCATREESGKDARTAHVTLYHDAEHPSFLELPLVK